MNSNNMLDYPRLIRSFRFAFAGITYAIQYNQNVRIHISVAVLVVVTSIIFQVNPYEMGILGVMILLVIATEMVNTAIEQMVNLITNDHKKEAKIAKDVSAGMVLLTAIGSVIVGILIFVPHIVRLFR